MPQTKDVLFTLTVTVSECEFTGEVVATIIEGGTHRGGVAHRRYAMEVEEPPYDIHVVADLLSHYWWEIAQRNLSPQLSLLAPSEPQLG